MKRIFWTATFTLTGTIIGAGILGLPFVFSQSGLLIGLFWLIFLGSIIMFVNLCLGEITLRTKEKHQLTGYARKYLGKKGQVIMFFAVIFGIYSALLAYLIGEGQSLSKILPGNINPLFLGIAFWIIMTLILREGLKGLKKTAFWGVLAVIAIIITIFVKFIPQVKYHNLVSISPSSFAVPIGVVLFAFLGFEAIPEIRREIYGSEKIMKKAIITGTLIPIIAYTLFSAVFVGILGKEVTEVATLSFGPLITLLGIFTMMTSFFVLSFSLKDTFTYDVKVSKTINFLFTSLIPLLIYIIVVKFDLAGFSRVLSVGGVISAGITGTLILVINKKSKEATKKKNPKIKMPINWLAIFMISLVFLAGILLEFLI